MDFLNAYGQSYFRSKPGAMNFILSTTWVAGAQLQSPCLSSQLGQKVNSRDSTPLCILGCPPMQQLQKQLLLTEPENSGRRAWSTV